MMSSLITIMPVCTLLLMATTVISFANADVPRTKWDKPDFRGTWDFRSITPFERPEYFKDKEYLTEDEIEEFEQAVLKGREERVGKQFEGQGDVDVGYNAFFLDMGEKMTGTMRTSLVIDPPDGRLPPMKEKAKKRMAEFIKLWSRAPHGPEDRNKYDRCLMGFNAGPPITPGAYNNIMQIYQTEQNVVIFTEMVNDHRIVPTNGSGALPDNMRLWKGSSSGHWEGDTFVISTGNFNDLQMFRGTGPNMKLTERLSLLDQETLQYEFTVDDPDTFEIPWTARLEMRRTDANAFEYACHEGNYAKRLMLKGARKQDSEAGEDDTWLPSWSKPRD